MITVAIQGIEGSFHEEAAHTLLGADTKIVSKKTFREVFEAVESDETTYGVSAVENSLYGSINPLYGLLETKKFWVTGEIFLKIEQYLIGHTLTDIKTLNDVETRVISQAPALAQVEQWLNTNLPLATRQESQDTAESVKFVVGQKNSHLLAVASKAAAQMYRGAVIAGPINDDPHNYTRFFLLSKSRQDTTDATRTSIILTTGHGAGDLYRALGLFADAQVNLSKLDSHPIASERRHYAFYVDFDLGIDDTRSTEIIEKLQKQGCKVQILGSYKAASLPE